MTIPFTQIKANLMVAILFSVAFAPDRSETHVFELIKIAISDFSNLQVRSLCGDGDSVLNTYVVGFLIQFIDNNLNYTKFGFSSFHVRICA